jgi:hypothetical protein
MHVQKCWRGCLRVMLPLAPLVALAVPAHAQISNCTTADAAAVDALVCTDPPGLADTAEPGSVLVFPKFAQGTIALDNGVVEPNTQIEIAATCPAPPPAEVPRCDAIAADLPPGGLRDRDPLGVPRGHCRSKRQRLPGDRFPGFCLDLRQGRV